MTETIIFHDDNKSGSNRLACYKSCFQQQLKNLGDRAVAYLNVDIAVEGMQALSAAGVPLLYDIVYDAAKKVSMAHIIKVASFL